MFFSLFLAGSCVFVPSPWSSLGLSLASVIFFFVVVLQRRNVWIADQISHLPFRCIGVILRALSFGFGNILGS